MNDDNSSSSRHLPVVRSLIAAYRERDYPAFLALLTDDIVYHWHVSSKPVVGKAKMQKFLNNYTGAYEQRVWRIDNWAEKEDFLLVEGYEELFDVKYQRVLRNPYMQAYEFRDGLIAKFRDYYEPAHMKPPVEAQA